MLFRLVRFHIQHRNMSVESRAYGSICFVFISIFKYPGLKTEIFFKFFSVHNAYQTAYHLKYVAMAIILQRCHSNSYSTLLDQSQIFDHLIWQIHVCLCTWQIKMLVIHDKTNWDKQNQTISHILTAENVSFWAKGAPIH